jgi:hypothetical protein
MSSAKKLLLVVFVALSLGACGDIISPGTLIDPACGTTSGAEWRKCRYQVSPEGRAAAAAERAAEQQKAAAQQAAEAERQRALAPHREKLEQAYSAQLAEVKRRIWATYSDAYAQMYFFEVLNVETSRISNEMQECSMAAATGMYRGPVPDMQTCVDVYNWKMAIIVRAYQS